MKKMWKRLFCLALTALMAVPMFACGGGGGSTGGKLDTESRPFVMAIAALDGNFNPFFSTSLTDSNVAGLTQASMLTTDQNGNLAYGDNWPTVTQDYKKTTLENGDTSYEFLIKNGMKFSDGKDLTINDVLFNLYVYLDPAYTGSATIYSTDIKGLAAYRNQDPDAQDGATVDDSRFYATASQRITDLINWSQDSSLTLTSAQEADLNRVKELFREEATSDWTAVETSWAESFKDTHNFTAAWQAYLYNEGLVVNQTDTQYKELKDENGKYYTTLDPIQDNSVSTSAENYATEIIEASTDALVQAYMSANEGVTEEYARTQLQKEAAVAMVVRNYTDRAKIDEVLSYWATASKALEEFAADSRSEYYEQAKENGENLVKNISGITHYSTTSFNNKSLSASHDVLKITINGIDPKAIWNFAFPVAPMHYYSDATHTTAANEELAKVRAGEIAVEQRSHFGVEIGNKDFFGESVLKRASVNGLPVGAGAYKATSKDGWKANVDRYDFFYNNIVFYERNTYYETMGKNITNAKIKYVRYQVMGDDMILTNLKVGNIDYGEPNATTGNRAIVAENSKTLAEETYRTAGYGYVGVNPKFVPDYRIRRAIMKSMNTASIIQNYYSPELAETIYRPMSATSWAYPRETVSRTDEKYSLVSYTTDIDEIDALVRAAGYTKQNGKWKKGSETLKFTFTIAGETTDHPAHAMFIDAAEFLNENGWDITVKPDIQALKKMNSGNLAVWAAAWSSGVDPDMYQVYHKDSKATSVNNWYYSGILENKNGKYDFEYDIVTRLSDKIEEARETDNQKQREEDYAECLDLVMELSVELPTYQRNDLAVYNKKVLNKKSLNQSPNHNMGLLGRIWEVDYL